MQLLVAPSKTWQGLDQWLLWGYWLPGIAELGISQLHWQQCWGVKGLQQICPLFVHPLSFPGHVQMCRFRSSLLNLISQLKYLLLWRRTFPHANVQNRYSLFFTEQNRFSLINSVQYFGTDPKARRRKGSMQTALETLTLAGILQKSKRASIQSDFPKQSPFSKQFEGWSLLESDTVSMYLITVYIFFTNMPSRAWSCAVLCHL